MLCAVGWKRFVCSPCPYFIFSKCGRSESGQHAGLWQPATGGEQSTRGEGHVLRWTGFRFQALLSYNVVGTLLFHSMALEVNGYDGVHGSGHFQIVEIGIVCLCNVLNKLHWLSMSVSQYVCVCVWFALLSHKISSMCLFQSPEKRPFYNTKSVYGSEVVNRKKKTLWCSSLVFSSILCATLAQNNEVLCDTLVNVERWPAEKIAFHTKNKTLINRVHFMHGFILRF